MTCDELVSVQSSVQTSLRSTCITTLSLCTYVDHQFLITTKVAVHRNLWPSKKGYLLTKDFWNFSQQNLDEFLQRPLSDKCIWGSPSKKINTISFRVNIHKRSRSTNFKNLTQRRTYSLQEGMENVTYKVYRPTLNYSHCLNGHS